MPLIRFLTMCLLSLSACAVSAAAAVTFDLLDPPGEDRVIDGALSDDGATLAVVSDGRYHRWTREGGFEDLGAGHALATAVGISGDGGTVCGAVSADDGARKPAVRDRDGRWTSLAGVSGSGGDKAGAAFDANADGSVVVGLAWDGERPAAFRWTPGGGAELLPDSGAGARATAVNGRGTVAAGFDVDPRTGSRRPARWVAGRLDLLAGPDHVGEVTDVDATGRRYCGQVDDRAFYRDDELGLVILGALDSGSGDRSRAMALTAGGVVVGWSGDPAWGSPEAFVWSRDAGMRRMSEWLAALGTPLPGGLELVNVLDASSDGSTMVGLWRDEAWNEGLWLVAGLDATAYEALARMGEAMQPWQGDLPPLGSPPSRPGRPVRFR